MGSIITDLSNENVNIIITEISNIITKKEVHFRPKRRKGKDTDIACINTVGQKPK